MTLTYEEGMATLRSVFPTWDPEVLAELLEANEGHLENTIDMALSMEPPTSTSSSQPPPPAPVVHTPPPAPAFQDSHRSGGRRSPHASPREQPRRSRVTLPDDFLRLPSDDGAPYADRPMSEQERQDAALAQMLQDEIFRQELFANEEFSAHFRDSRDRESFSRRSSTSGPREKTAAEIANETFNTMSTKFSLMSEAMKKKAHEMYLKFQTRSDAPVKQDPYSHRPLMSGDSSDEEDDGYARQSQTGDVRHRNAHDAAPANAFSPRNSGVSRRGNASSNKKDD